MEFASRFTGRASAYHAHRPRYPADLLAILKKDCGLNQQSAVADVGSGTGILTELFLQNGNAVHAIEPNAAMREIAEQNLASCSGFHSVAASAESTRLPDACIDFIIAGQAFHWFDRAKARAEFARILRPGGWTALVWNERLTTSTPFAAAYEEVLLAHSIDYTAVDPKKVSADTAAIAEFLGPGCRFDSRRHRIRSTFQQLAGLLESASYAPLPGHPKHEGMQQALQRAFDRHQEHGTVALDYEMKVYYARHLP